VVPTILYLVALLLGLLLGYLITSRVASRQLRDADLLWRERVRSRVAENLREREMEVRRDAAQRSGRALSGRVIERFAPIMEQFPFDPHDAVWIGDPVDFIVFDGLSTDRRDGGELDRIVLVEVKSGSGKLSRRQRRIKELVERGSVEWREIRLPVAPGRRT
jgi:predicted Holliday junction resolvase-like endonuclease